MPTDKWFWIALAASTLAAVGLVVGYLVPITSPYYFGGLLVGMFVVLALAAHHRRRYR